MPWLHGPGSTGLHILYVSDVFLYFQHRDQQIYALIGSYNHPVNTYHIGTTLGEKHGVFRLKAGGKSKEAETLALLWSKCLSLPKTHMLKF